ncbi:hypothetical protein LJC31_04935 [Synergistaceae bacterium OttesenSCG-928-I11]|nr:hypothetical protein [Synergistaceae bacterium OttesenSCG-928-I11]
MKKILLLFCVAMLMFANGAAMANADAGYYASTGYDADGSGNISSDAGGFDAGLVAHIQLFGNGTYEMLFFGALMNGEWRAMKTQKGSEYIGMLFGKTVDENFAKQHKKGELVFMLVRNQEEENSFWLMQPDSDEEVILEKQQGDMDVDVLLDRMERFLTGEG